MISFSSRYIGSACRTSKVFHNRKLWQIFHHRLYFTLHVNNISPTLPERSINFSSYRFCLSDKESVCHKRLSPVCQGCHNLSLYPESWYFGDFIWEDIYKSIIEVTLWQTTLGSKLPETTPCRHCPFHHSGIRRHTYFVWPYNRILEFERWINIKPFPQSAPLRSHVLFPHLLLPTFTTVIGSDILSSGLS